MQNSAQERRRQKIAPGSAQHRAATTQTPRRPIGAGGGEERAVRLGVRDHHTRSLCAQSPAQTEQWCCWFFPGRIIFGSGRKSRQFLPSQRLTNVRASIPAEILALGPSCVSPSPQLKRE